MTKGFVFSITFFLLFVSFGCHKSLSEEEQLQEDIRLIKEYIEKQGLVAEQTESGLFYVIENQGNGNFPKMSNTVRVRYKGYTLDNKVFETSAPEGIEFGLQNVIKGWQEGIPKFKEGGKGILLLPSKLAYGKNGAKSIKPDTVLIFEVELLTIVG